MMELEDGEYCPSTEENSPICFGVLQEDEKSLFLPDALLSSHERELLRLQNNEAEGSQELLELGLKIQRSTENLQAQVNEVRVDLGELRDQCFGDLTNMNTRLSNLEQAHVEGRQASGDQLGQVRLLIEQLFHQINTGDTRNNLEFHHLRQQLYYCNCSSSPWRTGAGAGAGTGTSARARVNASSKRSFPTYGLSPMLQKPKQRIY